MPDTRGSTRNSWLTTIGWAAYLGCSWTWCIGMFLPVLLLRDFGVWGFVVFAIPNVVGAAAMGWVLRNRRLAAAIYDQHRAACAAFTCVTVAFQLFFLVWALRSAGKGWISPGWIAVVAAAGALLLLLFRRGRLELVASIGIWLISAGVALCLLSRGALHAGLAAPPQLDAGTLAWLAPVCLFGFMLCPYLDATFHRACRESPDPRPAFGIGFGVFFFAMILFTLGYASLLLPMTGDESAWQRMHHADLVRAHVVVQLAFTILVHLLCWMRPTRDSRAMRGAKSIAIAAAVVLVGFGAPMVAHVIPPIAGLSGYEVMYRTYMAFYGLVFPAYVWICMIPTRDAHSGTLGSRGQRKLAVLGATILIALPFYWMGFIERQTQYLAPGLGLLLASRLLVLGERRLKPGEPGEATIRGGL